MLCRTKTKALHVSRAALSVVFALTALPATAAASGTALCETLSQAGSAYDALNLHTRSINNRLDQTRDHDVRIQLHFEQADVIGEIAELLRDTAAKMPATAEGDQLRDVFAAEAQAREDGADSIRESAQRGVNPEEDPDAEQQWLEMYRAISATVKERAGTVLRSCPNI
ncbi:hypothetical protein HMPREF9336_02976 [Segniliparus rugosus ATCC BAA-974]|uniref:Uncharacterized protein n=2 Tax=Segniliparus rugosus TaxID=286804 RepID=E5XU04_SEGRC|nr:hypothetical protein HMPREF9336_02976 [Segniliparus rugosus ATCC BAA-974]